jgi:hypothetical protein
MAGRIANPPQTASLHYMALNMGAQIYSTRGIRVPAKTPWPMVLALGLMLALSALVTHYAVAVVGALLFLCGAVGWWRQIFPHERHEEAAICAPIELESKPMWRAVGHLRVGRMGHRVRVPAHIQPYSAGIEGGLAGAVAMGIVAIVFGLLTQESPWYPINLFAAAVVPHLANASVAELAEFSAAGLIVGSLVHLLTSSLVGLLYAVTLPMFPRRAWLWAGLIAPLLWSGLIASVLDIVNPTLNSRIDWRWFVASQFAFGLVCGYVVARAESIETMQTWPLALRSGLESSDTMGENSGEE